MLSTPIQPRFLETDALGHINNTVLPMWFEAAREPVFKMFSPELNLKDWKLMLGKFTVTFHAETHYGSDIEIKTYISRIGGASFDVYQECWQNGIKTVSGLTTMIHFCHSAKKSQTLPEHVTEQMQQHLIALD